MYGLTPACDHLNIFWYFVQQLNPFLFPTFHEDNQKFKFHTITSGIFNFLKHFFPVSFHRAPSSWLLELGLANLFYLLNFLKIYLGGLSVINSILLRQGGFCLDPKQPIPWPINVHYMRVKTKCFPTTPPTPL
ncbi:MAG: hypothetical protein CM15mP117_00960 [Alphaproteobacteria bacterium]|nr:MAG: hypothetical protein CM15mP117_00960 [Alphaproteobacteria bacterium]